MNLEGGFQLQDLRGILRRRGKVMAACALVLVLAAYWLALALPNVYTSYATVLVEPQAVDPELVKAGVADSDLNRRLHLMTAEILSRPRLSRIIDDLDLYKDESEYMSRDQVIDLMRSQVRVEPVIPELEQGGAARSRGPVAVNEFQIYYDNYNRSLARDVAQRLANDFIETHIDERVRTSQKSLEFVEDELERLASDIQEVEADIARVKGDNPGRLPEDMASNQRRLERLIQDLSRLRGEYAEATSDEAFYSNQAATAKALGGGAGNSPSTRLEVLRLELAQNLSRGFTDKHPDIVRARDEIAQLEKIIASGSGDGPTLDPLAQQNEAAARRAALRRNAADEEIRRLEALASEVRDLLESTPEVAEQLDALNRRYEHLFNTYQDFSTRHNEAVVQAQLERRQLGEQFRVLEPAFEAVEPSAPNRLLILLLGGMFAVAAGVGLGILMEATDTSPHDARQLQSRMRLPVLAQIPQIWLESDRVRQRRSRIRTALATSGLIVFALVGGAANYFWVNGMPGFLTKQPAAAEKSPGPQASADEG